ncbi:MAG: DNA mismatch endonuclease Vsr [Deltaproteobacteria bacterium]|nr:DNA mismatch endonuclease Vsr [Deltaproteobacteria bacterium]MBW1910227.1 DNA mismatch endonuclease Vsr [Deltaproteobacteria bacterium]MBW2032314.1 DNA mismatch endonuclease Vsr [Deltaproteobacteria bacterium]MBW2113300.1 DNA mismatch endonuclease Vsr [Deltaproteobacteria bacterium]MBW2357462.1 DNA mismatch endonuclease Vsr [Deltaproteobacteria bacterium]
MTDVFSQEKRSWIMSRVKGRDTKPEILVRSFIFRMGFRFRLHRRDLPGTPDIVLPRHGKVIFVHGCFWHGHKRCPRSKRPTTNENFWNKKLDGNIKRDKRYRRELRHMGWKVLIVWECETKNPEKLLRKLERFLHDD